MRRAVLVGLPLIGLVVACGRPEPVTTPLPTKQGTIGRVNHGLEQAEQDAAKRREQVERSTGSGN